MAGISLAPNLALGSRGSSGGVPGSAITSFEIMGATPLLDATGDYGDATSRVGVNGNAWVAKITVPYTAAVTPDPTKISIAVSDPSDGGAGTPITRTITGTQILRRQYNANTSRQRSNDGVTETYYITLSGRIYSGTTIVSATATAGFYGAATAGAISSPLNSSSQAHWQPTCAWLNKQQERATTTKRIELDVSSAFARNSQSVARVVFKVKNPLGAVVDTYTVTTPTLSTVQRAGNITEAFGFDMLLANVPQAAADTDICTVDAEIYSWFSSAPYVLSTSGVAWPTQNPQTPLRFMCDKNGTYGGNVAPVKIGAAGTAAVYANEAAAQAGAALGNAYTTWAAAANALAAANTAKGHTTHHGSKIMLMEATPGGGATHVIATTTAATHASDGCWTETYVDPAASGVVNATFTGAATLKSLLEFNVDVIVNGGSATTAATYGKIAYTGTITQTTAGQINNKFALAYYNGVTFASTAGLVGFKGNGADKMVAVMLGCTATANTTASTIFPASIIGCNTAFVATQDRNVSQDDQNPYVKNNRFYKMQAACVFGTNVGFDARGVTVVQNVFERAGATVAPLCLSFSEEIFAIDNCIQQQNTMPGTDTASRMANFYCWKDGSQSLTKNLSSMANNLWYDTTMGKQDTNLTNSVQTGRVGNWAVTYHVDCYRNASVTGSSSDYAPDPDGTDFVGAYVQPSERWGPLTVTFVSNLAGGAAAGGGDYRLSGANTDIASMLGASDNCTRYDLLGNVRLTNGTEVPGAISKAA